MMLDGIRETGEEYISKSKFMAEYHVAADNPESLSPVREDDFHRGKDPRMDFSSKYPRQTKYSKTKAVNDDVSKCLKMANSSQDTASGRDTHFNRKTDNWSSSHGQFNELVRSTPDLNAQRNQSPNGSPKHCWSRSNRSRSRSPSRGSTVGSARRENRGRTRGGLAVHGRDFSDSKDDAKRSNWEDMTALQPTRRSGITHKESKGLVPALDPNDDLGRNISPGFEPRRQHIYNINPRHGCSQSERNWETASGDQTANEDGNSTRHSCGWGGALDQFEEWEGKISADQRWQRRSHSISPKHSWSRSPSPSLGLKPGTESWNNRGRTGTGGSAAPYRDFPTEKFGKGSHFRELGEDDAWRHSDNLSREIGESRFGRGGYSGYHGWENFDDSLEQKDYPRDRLLHRELSHHDGVWAKLERHKNNRSTEHHYVSTKERFPRGSSCNYVHHDVNSHGPWPMRDGARDRNYDRRDADSPFRQRFMSRRVSDTPCKFFAEGQCRRGEDCKFSHHLLHGHAKGRQQGDRRDHNKRSENASSLNGPKWGNRASIDDALVSSHEMCNGDGPRFTNPSSMDAEVSRKPEDAQSRMLEKGASQAASQSPEQIITQDACEQYGSAVSAHMMITSSNMEQIITNKEQVSGKGGCAVGDNARSEPEIDSATIPSAAVSFTEKNFSRSPHEQPLDPELHSSAPNVQYMEVAPLSPSGQILQETVCTMPPNGDTQLGICQVPSPVNKQMHSASQVGPIEQIQQSCVSHKIGPSQHIAHSVLNGQSNKMFLQDHPNSHPILISDDESEQDADNSNKGTSHVTSGTSTSEVLVIGSEVASVTNLTLSSSQVCQQPSQLQATVNPIGAPGSVLTEMASKPSSMSPPSPPLDCGQGFPMLHLSQMPVSDSSYKDAYLDENRRNDNLELKQVDLVGSVQVQEVTMPDTSENQKVVGDAKAREVTMSDSIENQKQVVGDAKVWVVTMPDTSENQKQVVGDAKAREVTMSDSIENQKQVVGDAKVWVVTMPDSSENQKQEVGDAKVQEVTMSDTRENQKQVVGDAKVWVVTMPDSSENQKQVVGDAKVREVTMSDTSENQKQGHGAPKEDVDPDMQVDDGNKKIKETNGMKMFKFALVEFVKDQLKPTWKEGHLSREAHKAIVKKVVDKVTSSVKGPNFPQTQQKVNLYMEHSKLKLSKLVQAYVARSIKS